MLQQLHELIEILGMSGTKIHFIHLKYTEQHH